jgi:hypothetical protein
MRRAGGDVARLELKRGDDWTLSCALADAAGNAVDLTDCAIRMHVRPSADSDTLTLSASTADGSIVIGAPATDGEFAVSFAATGTQDVGPGRYVTDIEITWADATQTSSETWQIVVPADVTRGA